LRFSAAFQQNREVLQGMNNYRGRFPILIFGHGCFSMRELVPASGQHREPAVTGSEGDDMARKRSRPKRHAREWTEDDEAQAFDQAMAFINVGLELWQMFFGSKTRKTLKAPPTDVLRKALGPRRSPMP
jgi:hypothetical protein